MWFQVFNVQTAGYSAAIVHNYEGNDSIMPMSGDSKCKFDLLLVRQSTVKCCESIDALGLVNCHNHVLPFEVYSCGFFVSGVKITVLILIIVTQNPVAQSVQSFEESKDFSLHLNLQSD